MCPPSGSAHDHLFHSGQAPFQQSDGPKFNTNKEGSIELEPQSALRHLASLTTSIHFAFALQLSGLTDPSRVIRFLLLPFHRAFDPSLGILAAGTMPLTIFLYHYARGNEIPRLGGRWSIPKKDQVDWKLIVGSAIFGISWGMAGVCREFFVDRYADQLLTIRNHSRSRSCEFWTRLGEQCTVTCYNSLVTRSSRWWSDRLIWPV